jgi:acyl carrier protein
MIEGNQIYGKLTEIFQAVFNDDSLIAVPTLCAASVDGWDSLNHLRLILSVEKHFGVKFSAYEIGRLQNVGDFVELIQSKLRH